MVFADLGLAPATLTLGSNSAIHESVQIGLGITLISADSVAAELEAETIEEWRYGPLPLHREWHLVARYCEPRAAGRRRPPPARAPGQRAERTGRPRG